MKFKRKRREKGSEEGSSIRNESWRGSCKLAYMKRQIYKKEGEVV